ncbi:conjugative transposon protein TraN [Parachryseolinea silvisoli]|uniref:conjugative transposon protein TraN n=1 Tax=Parachryseolinea silvisoli TaxID=2873601 RepID=UPI002265C839|nr:conjugative transposon protein TraN [Parachryseolinea silvisoli]MCD9015235.1 conjugative transposon protein TraN [Parachryseolinea silvisoli]
MASKSNRSIIAILMVSLCSVLAGASHAQSIAYSSIDVTMRKTTSIVFPVGIKSGDRGSNDILVQKAKGARNVLKVKAGRKNFQETNLTVITDDGSLHHYLVRFSDQPRKYVFFSDSLEQRAVVHPLVHLTEANLHVVEEISKSIVASNNGRNVTSTRKNQMRLALKGIYIEGQTMFYHLQIVNKSNIPYDIDLLQFIIKDKQNVKRMASQEAIERPVFVYGDPAVVAGKATLDLVYALPKFTIPDAKDLVIQLMESRGGRHLEVRVKNKSIIRAKVIEAPTL